MPSTGCARARIPDSCMRASFAILFVSSHRVVEPIASLLAANCPCGTPVSGCRGSTSHGVLNRRKKADIVERLVDMPCEASRLYAPMVSAAGEARNGDDRLVRVAFHIAQRVKELESVHVGHLEIADHQIDVLGHHRLQRLDSIPRRHDIGAKPFERQASHLARVFYIFDHENAEAIQPLQATRPD